MEDTKHKTVRDLTDREFLAAVPEKLREAYERNVLSGTTFESLLHITEKVNECARRDILALRIAVTTIICAFVIMTVTVARLLSMDAIDSIIPLFKEQIWCPLGLVAGVVVLLFITDRKTTRARKDAQEAYGKLYDFRKAVTLLACDDPAKLVAEFLQIMLDESNMDIRLATKAKAVLKAKDDFDFACEKPKRTVQKVLVAVVGVKDADSAFEAIWAAIEDCKATTMARHQLFDQARVALEAEAKRAKPGS